MLIKKDILHSVTILFETGHIEVKRQLFVLDDETGEETPRQNWRGVVDPGDTKKVDALLGAFSEEVKAAAGKNLGGWAKLEQNRTKTIEAVENV